MSDRADDSLDVIERSSQYFLTRDEDGYALWQVRGNADEPVLTFPLDEDGEERARAAFRRESRMGAWAKVLVVAAFVSAIVWFVAQAVFEVVQIVWTHNAYPFFGNHVSGVYLAAAWASAVSSIGNAAFTIAVGLTVVIWLHRRYRREG